MQVIEAYKTTHEIRNVPARLIESAQSIGLLGLEQEAIKPRFIDIQQRLVTGLRRSGEPTIADGGMAADEGFASFRTGIPLISNEAWGRVPNGTESYVASVGGTNTKYYKTTKESETDIRLERIGELKYEQDAKKQLTFAEFIDRTVKPIAEAYNNASEKPDRLHFGISLAFAHKNIVTEEGLDAEFSPLDEFGTFPKGWKITDWAKIPEKERGFIQAIKRGFQKYDIDPAIVNAVILNDTPGTALDSSAARKATEDGKKILAIGAVGGTGTNFAGDQEGLINFELGRWPLPKDTEGKADNVTERVLDNMLQDSLHFDPAAKRGVPELENETGGKYAPERLRAGIQILGEQMPEILPDANELADWIKVASEQNETLISDLASGKLYISDLVQRLAQGVLTRAGQHFGLASAAVADVLYGDRQKEDEAALLVEGSFVNRATGVKDEAEKTAFSLGQPISIYEANSIKGVGALAMSWEYQLAA